MNKEKFKFILETDEDVKLCEGVNTNSYVKKHFLNMFLFGLFPPFAILMLGVPYSWLILILSIMNIIPLGIGIVHFIFSIIVCLVFAFILRSQSKNTFLCITNKRIIKRYGAFNNKFVNYSLKNIGTIEVAGGLFDRKNKSANLIITVKDYHTDTNGNAVRNKIEIVSLNNAYEAYKLLNKLTEGNNEVLRIKEEN